MPRGILPAGTLADFCAKGFISTGRRLVESQIQPASLDLRLGDFVEVFEVWEAVRL